MAVKSSGSLSFNTDIVGEFGGSTPHSLSEYYRGGANVPSGVTDVPTSGAINFSDFYGTSNAVDITYYVVGAGGGGGGAGNGGAGGDGGSTSISGTGFTTVTSAGGTGGRGGAGVITNSAGTSVGGAGGSGTTIGGLVRGAGGNGGVGRSSPDSGSDYDLGGGGGGGSSGSGDPRQGGDTYRAPAGEYKTSTLSNITVGTVITVTIGSGGTGGVNSHGGTNGQNGGAGFVRLTINGTDYDFTSSGTHTV